MSTSAPIVKAENVEKYFGRHRVLCEVSLEVQRREVVCIIGPSGSGKTTFRAASTTSSGSTAAASR